MKVVQSEYQKSRLYHITACAITQHQSKVNTRAIWCILVTPIIYNMVLRTDVLQYDLPVTEAPLVSSIIAGTCYFTNVLSCEVVSIFEILMQLPEINEK